MLKKTAEKTEKNTLPVPLYPTRIRGHIIWEFYVRIYTVSRKRQQLTVVHCKDIKLMPKQITPSLPTCSHSVKYKLKQISSGFQNVQPSYASLAFYFVFKGQTLFIKCGKVTVCLCMIWHKPPLGAVQRFCRLHSYFPQQISQWTVWKNICNKWNLTQAKAPLHLFAQFIAITFIETVFCKNQIMQFIVSKLVYLLAKKMTPAWFSLVLDWDGFSWNVIFFPCHFKRLLFFYCTL